MARATRLSLAVVAIASGVLGGAAHAAGIYKWTDAEGRVHFGDKPPANAAAQELHPETKADAQNARRLRNLENTATTIGNALDAQRAAADRKQKAEEAHAAACAKSRQYLDSLRTGRRRKQYIDANGERAYVTEAQRADWTAKAEEEVKRNCGE